MHAASRHGTPSLTSLPKDENFSHARLAEIYELGRRDPGEAGSYKQHQVGWPG